MRAYYLLTKTKLPNRLDEEVNQAILEVSRAKTREDALLRAYKIVTTKYTGSRLATITKFFDLFSSSIQDIWNRTGFLHCTNQNYLLTLLLVNSGHFEEHEIRPKWTFLWGISPHQYLQVQLNNQRTTTLDPWSSSYNIKFGDYAHGWHVGSRKLK